MQRRLFLWFGATILATGLVVGVSTELMGRSRWAFVLGAAAFLLWGAAGGLAHRLLSPLRELVRTAGAIGDGRFEARARLGRHTHSELHVLGEAMNDMAARIEKQLRDQRELLAAVSHELRTPLGHLRVILETERERTAPGSPTARALDEMEREVVEIDALVGELLASSRLEFGSLAVHSVSLEDVARDALARAGQGSERLAIDLDDPFVRADPTLLARAVANLLDNAERHGDGVVVLRLCERDGRPCIEVEDRGSGLAAADLERVFDPFFRRDRAAGAGHGSLGLGLSLVRRLARAHGGESFAENVAGGGARVGLTLARAGRGARYGASRVKTW